MQPDEYYIYLRKSRADYEAEQRGEGETLAKHEKALTELAQQQNLKVTKIFREIVSGETLAARPQVQKLLREVQQGIPAGVLVMEIERLARGDTKDQGIVAEAFKYGNVKIITPMKAYDPNNEFDEEYFEFGLFMSRREYKTIRRRLWNGRLAAVKSGKWIASTAPYGYQRIKIQNDKGYTLEILPEEAEIVRYIYDLYLTPKSFSDSSQQTMGYSVIAGKLQSMNIHPRKSDAWNIGVIKDILTNPVYIGKIRWGYRPYTKVIADGNVSLERRKNINYDIYDGLHEPLISQDVFNRVQNRMKKKKDLPIPGNRELKNPLSGVVRCGLCGKNMIRIPGNKKTAYSLLMCPNKNCSNISAPLYLVEAQIQEALRQWFFGYTLVYPEQLEVPSSEMNLMKKSIQNSENDLQTLQQQLENVYDMVEQGLYSAEIFMKRSHTLTDKISKVTKSIKKLNSEYEELKAAEDYQLAGIPQPKKIWELYQTYASPRGKNDLLKLLFEYVEYTKSIPNKKGNRDVANFQLKCYPRVPR